MDPVFDFISATRLTGGLFLDAEFTAPWSVTAKVGPEDCFPVVPAPLNIVAYHYVSEGAMVLEVDDGAPVTVGAGKIVVLPRNREHRLGSAPNLRPVRADTLVQPPAGNGLARIVHGGGGARTRMLCGFLGNDTPHDPVLHILPDVLVVDVADAGSASWIESSLRFAAHELADGRVRSTAVVARLAGLLFLEAVRRYIASVPDEQSDWCAGLRDRVVGRALALLHGRMRHAWTAEELARAVGLSRSAFAERFSRVMGEPPMRYLARQRLQTAARKLEQTRDSVARIAFDVGYESEAAFNRAFKREFGSPPASWRDRTKHPL